MAMTFTLVTHLREQLLQLVNSRIERKEKEEMEKGRLAIEVCMGQYVLTRKDPDPFICYRQKKHVREAHQSR